MRTYEIIFSPTGGTKKVSHLFAEAFGKETVQVDLMDREVDFESVHFAAEDVCIVAVPSYGGRVPGVAVSRLKQMQGNGAKAILLAVYGNRAYEDTLLELKDALTETGFGCVAAVAAIAEHSIMHEFAAGRPDEEDGRVLASFAAEIREKLEQGDTSDKLDLPGNRPYRDFGGVPMKPKTGKACIRCGLCVKKCPVGAISEEDPTKTDEERCISCMGCIAVCPSSARSISRLLVNVAAKKMKKACSVRKECELFL